MDCYIQTVMFSIACFAFGQVHFSHKQATYQSGSRSSLSSDAVMDGDRKTCSYPKTRPSSKNTAWWKVKLDGMYLITGVVLAWDSNETNAQLKNNLDVYISTEGDAMMQMLCSSHRSSKKRNFDPMNLTCKQPLYGRFLIIAKADNSLPSGLFLCEVYIYTRNSPASTVYLSTNQNGVLFKETSDLAVDGDERTCARIQATKWEMPWWYLRLNEVYEILGVSIYFKGNSSDSLTVNNLNIFVSNNVEDLEQQFCGGFGEVNSSLADKYAFFDCEYSVSGSIITIKKDGGYKPRSLVLCEVQVASPGRKADCSEGSVECGPSGVCVAKENICDRMKDCPDGSDEKFCECLDHQFKCASGMCIHRDWLCDGVKDCPFGDDEKVHSCHSCGSSRFKCFKNNLCIRKSQRCDGLADCPDSSDEQQCLKLDSTRRFLTANFKGGSNFFICSKNWSDKLSLYACREMGFNIFKESVFSSVNASKILKLKNVGKVNRKVPFMHIFQKSSDCETKEFVRLWCPRFPSYECGIRGVAEHLLGPYIINGAIAKPGAWPWHVQVIEDFDVRCGGSILSRDTVLTAAHCVELIENPAQMHVKVGTILRNDPKAKRYPVKRIIIHPQFNESDDDIAILKLNMSLRFNDYVKPICLPSRNLVSKEVNSYRYCVISGFGVMKEGLNPRFLMQGRMDLSSKKNCASHIASVTNFTLEEAIDTFKNKSLYCIGPFPNKYGVTPALGDSGSPLVCRNEHGRWTQVGLHHGRFESSYGETYTNVIMISLGYYLEFIKSHI